MPKPRRPFWKRVLVWSVELVGIAFFALLLLFYAVRQPSVQSYATRWGLNFLEKTIHSRVHADSIYVDIFNKIHINGLYIEDWDCDTLAYVRHLHIGINNLDLYKLRFHIDELVLEQPYFQMKRKKDEDYNLDYIINMLVGSGKKTNTPPPNNAPQINKDPLISLERIVLEQPRYVLKDEKNKMYLSVNLHHAETDIEGFDLFGQCFEFGTLLLDQPRIILHQGETPKEPDIDRNGQLMHISPEGWEFKAKKFRLNKGYFSLNNGRDTLAQKGRINFDRLRLNEINGNFEQVFYARDTIAASQAFLSARDAASGFDLRELSCNLLFTARGFELQNMLLRTPDSRLGNYLQMKYRTLRDFGEFVDRVRFKAFFDEKSKFTFKDIYYFTDEIAKVPLLKHNMEQTIYLSGEVGEKIKRLQAKKLNIKIGSTHLENSELSMTGLPEISSTFIDFKTKKLTTSIAAVRLLLPPSDAKKIPSEIDLFGNIVFKGSFLGFPSDFVAFGDFKTDIGQIRSDLKMDLRGDPKYSGDLAVRNFALGKIVKQPDLGNITFDATLAGKGFDINKLAADIDANVQEISYKNKTYNNITIDGRIDKKLFSGNLSIQDEDIQVSHFSGIVNLNGNIPQFDFKASVEKIDLKRLQLLPPEQQKKFEWIIAGKTELNFKGNNLDNIQGTAKLENLRFKTPTREVAIAKFEASSFSDTEGKRELTVKSDFADIGIKGSFTFKDLPLAFQNHLHHYFPYRFKYAGLAKPQNVQFDISLRQPDRVLSLFVPEIQSLPEATIKGAFDSQTKQLLFAAQVPQFWIDSTRIHAAQVAAASDAQKMVFDISTDSLVIKGGTNIPTIKFKGAIFNDTIDFDLHAAADTAANRAHLTGLLFANSDTLKMQFDTTELYVNRQKWEATTGTFAYKNQDYFEIENLVLSQGEQQIALQSHPSEKSKNYTEINLSNINLMDFKYIKPIGELGIETQISGQMTVKDIFGKQMLAAEVLANNFVFRGQQMGDIKISAGKQKNSNLMNVALLIEDNKDYDMEAMGIVALPQKKGDEVHIDVRADFKKANLAFIEAFAGSLVSKSEGKMEGYLTFKGNIARPFINGQILVRKAATTINYLQTRYELDKQLLVFDNNKLVFDNIQIHDKDRNTASLSGYFNLNDFKNLSLDLRMESQNFLFLDTKLGDNSTFYGKAYAGGYVTFKGPVERLELYVNAKSGKNTTVYLPLAEETAAGENSIYTFVDKTTKDSTSLTKLNTPAKAESGMKVNLDLDLTPDAEIQLVFDQQAGDIIRARGKGNMQLYVSTIGDPTYGMYGKYEIESGSYLFTLKNIINKQFSVERGGTITFSGNPYDAVLDLSAVYNLKATRSDFFGEQELVSLSDAEKQQLKKRSNVDVFLNMTGILANPNIAFKIGLPKTNNSRVDELVEGKLNEMTQGDQNELNRQVFGLLVLNRFMPPERFELDVKAGGLTTISEMLSNYLSSYLNELAGGFVEINLNWRNYDESSSTGGSETRNEIEFGLSKKLFNDRLEFQFGGNVDVGGSNQSTGNSGVAGAFDFTVVYRITSDGRIRVQAFSKSDYDVFNEQYTKIGGGLSVSREFDSFADLFDKMRGKKRAKAKNQQN